MDEGARLIYGISDLHFFLEGGQGGNLPSGFIYEAIPSGLIRQWREEVWGHDLVLVPGDISDSSPHGGMYDDYRLLEHLPGEKILSPGNHDQGPWQKQAKIERFCRPFSSLRPIVSGATRIASPADAPGVVIAAAEGACAPGDQWFGGELHMLGPANPRRRFNQALAALGEALDQAKRIADPGDRLIVQIHYPPFVNFTTPGPFSDLIESSGADLCIYGHLHQEDESGFEGERSGVRYRIVAAPRVAMRPLRLADLSARGVRWAV